VGESSFNLSSALR